MRGKYYDRKSNQKQLDVGIEQRRVYLANNRVGIPFSGSYCSWRDSQEREKIEDLLEDCNFHQECGLLADGKYGEYLDFVFEEYVRFNFV